jgi:DNA replicative helicase MCM subunit Mcm2 (Cdc46/Mcm family)
VLEVLDGIEKKLRREEETMLKKAKEEEEDREYRGMIEKLKELVERKSKRLVMNELKLKNNPKLLDKILNSYEGYPYYLFKRIRSYLTTAN